MFMIIGIIVGLVGGGFLVYGYVEEENRPKLIGILLLIVAMGLVIVHFNTAQGSRDLKSIKSNTTGGIERTVEVYDQNGKLIKTYDGKIDIQENEYGNKVLFDMDGKRTVIYNATVIVQEK